MNATIIAQVLDELGDVIGPRQIHLAENRALVEIPDAGAFVQRLRVVEQQLNRTIEVDAHHQYCRLTVSNPTLPEESK